MPTPLVAPRRRISRCKVLLVPAFIFKKKTCEPYHYIHIKWTFIPIILLVALIKIYESSSNKYLDCTFPETNSLRTRGSKEILFLSFTFINRFDLNSMEELADIVEAGILRSIFMRLDMTQNMRRYTICLRWCVAIFSEWNLTKPHLQNQVKPRIILLVDCSESNL